MNITTTTLDPTLVMLGRIISVHLQVLSIAPREAALRLRVPVEQLEAWLAGQDPMPLDVLVEVALMLGATPSQLLAEVEAVYPCQCEDDRCAGFHHAIGEPCWCTPDSEAADAS
ncbi:MAG: hypothetical protein QM286_13675 [Acidobacteriota bacterium]|nr:hypothetical protein [Acidobacteriota bacterium]